MPARLTSTSNCPSRGSGSDTSARVSTSGPPNSVMRMARTMSAFLARERRSGTRHMREPERLGRPARLNVPALAGPARGKYRDERVDHVVDIPQRDAPVDPRRPERVDDGGVGGGRAQRVDPDPVAGPGRPERPDQADDAGLVG